MGKEQAQSQEPKAHRQKRKRQNIATTNKDEENEPNTRIPKRNNNKTYDGVTDGPMNKKSNNKRRRYQQISDSSDTSDTEDEQEKDKEKATTQEETVEPRKGIG